MNGGVQPAPPVAMPGKRRRRGRMAAIAGLLLLLLACGGLAWLDSAAGHRFIVGQIEAQRPANGLRFAVGRIEGSIWRRLRLVDVAVGDSEGRFLAVPSARLDWWPLGFLFGRLSIDRLVLERARLDRLPRTIDTGREGPTLPDFDIFVGELAAPGLTLGPEVTGQAQRASLSGHADIRDGRARFRLALATGGSGDRLDLDGDISPDAGRFRLEGALAAPRGGLIGRLAKIDLPLAARLGGRGDWESWTGQLVARSGRRDIARLKLAATDGLYRVNGPVEAAPFLSGVAARALPGTTRLALSGRFADRIASIDGTVAGPALGTALSGGWDFADGGFDQMRLAVARLSPGVIGRDFSGAPISGQARLDGRPARIEVDLALASRELRIGEIGFTSVRATGDGRVVAGQARLPFLLTAEGVTGVGPTEQALLAGLDARGVLRIGRSGTFADAVAIRTRGATARADIAFPRGRPWRATADARLPGFRLGQLGTVDVAARMLLGPAAGGRIAMQGQAQARMTRLDNSFFRTLAGGLPRIASRIALGPDRRFRFDDFTLTAPLIRFAGDGLRERDGSFRIEGNGRHGRYGAFDMALLGRIERPQVALLFDRPFDPAGLRAVTLVLDPSEAGFGFDVAGGSLLGPFRGEGAILLPPGGQAVIRFDRLRASATEAEGFLRPLADGFEGRFALAGGGVNGSLLLDPDPRGQRLKLELAMLDARFEADRELLVRRGRAEVDALIAEGRTSLDATISAEGVSRGGLILGRLAANARLVDGRGRATASFAGTRGSAFEFRAQAAIAPARIDLTGQGSFRRRAIALRNPARLVREGAAWRLLPVTLTYGGGSARLAGLVGGGRSLLDARFDRLPLDLLDLGDSRLGLAGRASGTLTYADAAGLPTGNASLKVTGLSRAGLLNSSAPLDLALNAALTGEALAVRAVMRDPGGGSGRVQLRAAPLGGAGTLAARLFAAPLFAQLRYQGRADTLWRLTGVETFDIAGPVALGADVRGRLGDPRIVGALRTEKVRLTSPVAGTVIENIASEARFDGSRLVFSRLSGSTPGGGSVTGAGSFDFSRAQGIGIDLRLDASRARLLARDDIAATVSGPLRVTSGGNGGQVEGDVTLDSGRFRLGQASAAAELPRVRTREINARADAPLPRARSRPWRLAVQARARDGLTVEGLGLDSEWAAQLAITGRIDDPRLEGRARLVRGSYDFAGRSFRLDRGEIVFRGRSPPDPTLDIVALADVQGIDASIRVGGTGTAPAISFASTPALPEDELLSRLLFGTSITNLSAPEALQLATAVAGLRGDGSLDPINAIRRAAGLDRLRFLPADASTGQGTAVAAGKYIGRRTYVELVTDGQGYSATRAEFQVTRWLSILSSISTIGRQSVNVRASRDY